MTDLVGFIAGLLGIASYLPQPVKLWRTKSSADLAVWMWTTLTVDALLWISYGVLSRTWPVVFTNTALFILVVWTLVLTLKYQRAR